MQKKMELKEQQYNAARSADKDMKNKGGDRAMQLASLMQEKERDRKCWSSNEDIAPRTDSNDRRTDSVTFEMTLHVPCYVAGKTANGSRWKGKTKTVALSSFRAHLLLPEHVDLEGELFIRFHVPSALKVLFIKSIFHLKAEITSLASDAHWPAPSGQKVVCVVFSHPLKFASWAA